MTPELIIALGTAVSATLGAILGGKNSLNGFKTETRESLKAITSRTERIESKVDSLSLSDAIQTERLRADGERISKLEDDVRRPTLVEDEVPR
jgi:hypothetical protein